MVVAQEVERSSINVRVGGLIPGPLSLHRQDRELHIAPGGSSIRACVRVWMVIAPDEQVVPRMAWPPLPPVYECVHEWVNADLCGKELSAEHKTRKALHKYSPFSI